MATVEKASLRSEFDALKGRFGALCAAGGMSAESRALFDALLMLFELLLAVFMERNTPKNARNSGLPSSRARDDGTARRRAGANDKGPRTGAARDGPNRLVVETRAAPVDECRACGRGLVSTEVVLPKSWLLCTVFGPIRLFRWVKWSLNTPLWKF